MPTQSALDREDTSTLSRLRWWTGTGQHTWTNREEVGNRTTKFRSSGKRAKTSHWQLTSESNTWESQAIKGSQWDDLASPDKDANEGEGDERGDPAPNLRLTI